MIVTNPELLMKPGDTGFSKLFKSKKLSKRIIGVVLDEAHCISDWGTFRPNYKEIGRLQSVLPGVKFHITSATLPEYVLNDVLNILNISRADIFTIHRSNDRPNVAIVVREIQSMSTFADLDFLVNNWAHGGPPPPKFLILFDNINDCTKAGRRLRSQISDKDKDLIKWHNSSMSPEYRVKALEDFLNGELLGFCATDTLGIVSTPVSSQ